MHSIVRTMEEKKTKRIRKIIVRILAALFSVAICLYAVSSALFGVSFRVSAQVATGDEPLNQSAGTDTIVYLVTPDTSTSQPPVLQGQPEFHMRIVPDDKTASVGIAYIKTDNTVIDGHCETLAHDTTGLWRLRCESMHIPNGTYSVRVNAQDNTGQPIELVDSAGLPPVFGPIYVYNTYRISLSGDQQKVSGTVTITTILPGEAAEVRIRESGPVTVQQAATRDQASLPLSVWSAVWDTTTVPDGDYAVLLDVKTRPGVLLEAVYTRWVKVSNAPLCSVHWECGDWSLCVNGNQTRNCVDTNACGTDAGNPPVSQGCTDSVPDSSDTNQATNTNADTSVAPPIITIISPTPDTVVQGTVELLANVAGLNTSSVSFYFNGSRTNVFIGTGALTGEAWRTVWDTRTVADGQYDVVARVETSSGEVFASQPVRLSVVNEATEAAPVEYPATSTDDDADGIPTAVEEQYGLNPNIADSDDDGRADASEIIEGDSPRGEGSLEEDIGEGDAKELQTLIRSLSSDDPQTAGDTSDDLQIVSVFNTTVVGQGGRIVISGVGPPNSSITLFIYSTPLVVVTKTDESGNFTYVLDKDVSDGEHEVYATITDQTGKIVKKSSPLKFFIREARAVNEEEYLRGYTDVDTFSSELVREYIIIAILLVLGGFFIYVLVRVVRMRHA